MKGRRIVRCCCGAFVWILTLMSCQIERPETVMSDVQMERVLYDYHIARAIGEEVPYDENYKRVLYVESVFKKHGITQASFDSSMVWFARNPEVLSKIYEKVNEKLRAEKEHINSLIAIRDNKPKESQPGDSIDVWMWQHIYRLTGIPLNNRMSFTLVTDTNFYERDTLCWSVRFRFEERTDTFNLPVMALQIQYENDSLVGQVNEVRESGVQSISLSADMLGPIKEVRGFIYYPLQSKSRVLLLDHISLMRYHATDSLSVSPDTIPQADKKQNESVVKEEKKIQKPKLKRSSPQRQESPRLRMETKELEQSSSLKTVK